MLHLLILPLLLDLTLTVASVSTSPTVSLSYGTFQGVVDRNLSTFLGVPFAAPAIRFALPEAPRILHGVQDATAFGPACPQQQLPILSIGDPNDGYNVSEDCLTLNVFAPNTASRTSKLPVFFYIHGGGYQIGSSQDQDVRPLVERSIFNEEPIVVVTVNYRLSALGFLGGKEIRDAGISNLGLRDQIFALEWVQQHVIEFGGDPERVIIAGFSAGAASTCLLLLNNNQFQQTSLIRGAVMISGSPTTTPSLTSTVAQSAYDSLVASSNCTLTHDQDTLGCLREVPFETLMAAINETPTFLGYTALQLYWRPLVDGEVILKDPLVAISQGEYAKIPILTGDVEDEGRFFPLEVSTSLEVRTTKLPSYLKPVKYLPLGFFPTATPEQITSLVALYPNDPAQPEYKRIAAFQGDYLLTGMRRFFLEHVSKTQQAWSYLSKRATSVPFLGSFHGSDVPMWLLEDETDHVAADSLINFVNTLNPNLAKSGANTTSGVFWPTWNTPSAAGAASLLTFGDPLTVNVTAEDFRVDAIESLNSLQLSLAEAEQTLLT